MIRLLTNSFSCSIFQPGLRLCSTTGTGSSQKKVASTALSRLIPEANDHAVRALPPEFRQLVREGLKEAHNKNFQLALSLLQRSITCLPNTPVNQEQRNAVEFYVNEIKSKMQFLDNVENSTNTTLENRFIKEVYNEASSGNLLSRTREIQLYLNACIKHEKSRYKSLEVKRPPPRHLIAKTWAYKKN